MPLLTPATITALVERHGLRQSRALGQNFLADPNTARRIVRLAGVEPGDAVVEIGPGIGSLTVALAAAGASVTALELDRHVLPALAEVVADQPGVRVVQGDALTEDFAALLPERPVGWKLVVNLPYNVATPIVARVLEEAPMVGSLLFMVQREVGERLAAGPGGREYGAISVKVAYYGHAQVVGLVPRTVFLPPPNVESALVRIVRHAAPPVDVPSPAALFGLVRAGFGHRRKMLRRALKTQLGDRTLAVLEAAGVDPQARAEALDLTAWAAITRAAGVTLELLAPAKLTLTLRVLGTRDDGFHDLEALTVSIDAPYDTLSFEPGPPGVRLAVTGPAASGVPENDDNLAVRAALAVLPDDAGLQIGLRKQIPSGAGLGGGSADAAAVLRVCADSYGLAPEVVTEAAAAIGSDVPFCLHAGPAWMRGRGERIDAVTLPAAVRVLVVVPPFKVATAAVYRAWDDLGGPSSDRRLPPPRPLAHLVDGLVNDLAPAAEHVEPRLAPFRRKLEAAAGAPALLAGSGSACWIPFEDPETCREAGARVEAALGVPTYLGMSLPPRGKG